MKTTKDIRKIHIAPSTCIIGPGVLKEIGEIVREIGEMAFIISGKTAFKVTERELTASLEKSGLTYEVNIFKGECSINQILKYSSFINNFHPDLVIGIGGGKALDTAKAAASFQGLPCITIPTSAATCAAYTSISILHTDKGEYVEAQRLKRCPDFIIVDPDIIITAPARMLAAGVSDALARTFETELAASQTLLQLPLNAMLSVKVSQEYYTNILKSSGLSAINTCKKGVVNEDFKKVVETNICGAGLASGLSGSFYRLNIAHSIAYALTHFLPPDVLHGEEVAIGILVQHTLEDPRGAKAQMTRAFLSSLGLSTKLSELGLKDHPEIIRALAHKAIKYLDLVHAVPFTLTEKQLINTILEAV